MTSAISKQVLANSITISAIEAGDDVIELDMDEFKLNVIINKA